MGREYVIQSWVKHPEDDRRVIHDSEIVNKGYSGEQIGNRQLKSTEHMRSRAAGYLPNGNADLTYYPDQDEIFKDNILFEIDPAFKKLAFYQDQIFKLDKALKDKLISKDRHDYALRILDAQIYKAEKKLDKLAYGTIPEDEVMPVATISAQEIAEDNLEYYPNSREEKDAIYYYENGLI